MLGRVNFRHNLTKQQKQEGEQDGHKKEFQQTAISENQSFTEKEIQQHDDSHIHEIVGVARIRRTEPPISGDAEYNLITRRIKLAPYRSV